jgi:23S rRNA (cytosine1962-C5)-methyltransferase
VLGQKTGHFLDQRDNRARVRELAEGHDTLDVFCCTGGFSVHATAGGATSVRSVDVSPGAIRSTERNMALNVATGDGPRPRHTVVVADAADEMARLSRTSARFGLVVLDPPSLAVKASQRPAALGAYRRLGELASALVEPGGTLVAASCSSRITADEHASVIHEAAAASGRRLSELERTGHALDHPVGFPEGAYLKALFARID